MSGPGTQLKAIFADLGIVFAPDCPCDGHATQMDEWGIGGCRENRDTIIGWLRAGVENFGWAVKLKAAANAVVSGLAFQINWLDPFPAIVDRAVALAEKPPTDFGHGCMCEFRGVCDRYKREMSARELQICRGENISEPNRERYVGEWSREPAPPAGDVSDEVPESVARAQVTPRRSACKHLGGVVREQIVTRCCGSGDQKVAISSCANFQSECQISQQVEGVRSCLGCPAYSPISNLSRSKLDLSRPIDRSKLVTHILYHVMPLNGTSEAVWRRHVAWLREVRQQFNGRLIVGIVTKNPSDTFNYCDPSEVVQAFDGMGAEFVLARNDHSVRKNEKGIGEGVLFPMMLDLIRTDNPNEVFLYGHCKGVTRADNTWVEPPHLWAEAMFETLFRNLEEVVHMLDAKPITGSFQMHGGRVVGLPGVGPHWFYSGTFFAARSAAVFAKRDWRKMARHYGSVEQWPRMNFDLAKESSCIFWPDTDNLYDAAYWEKEVTPAFEKWKAKHGPSSST